MDIQDRAMEEKEHADRLKILLDMNNLTTFDVSHDGDCVFTSVFTFLDVIMTEEFKSPLDIRHKVLEEIYSRYELYSGFNTCFDIQEMRASGSWNSDLGDLIPFATANVLKCTLHIFSSHSQRSVYTINPSGVAKTSSEVIKLAHLAARGFEHYQPCVSKAVVMDISISLDDLESTSCIVIPTSSLQNETIGNNAMQDICDLSNNIDANMPDLSDEHEPPSRPPKTKWKRMKAKKSRNCGQPYINSKGNDIPQRQSRVNDCSKCKFDCNKLFTTNNQNEICKLFRLIGNAEDRSSFIPCFVNKKQSQSMGVKKNSRTLLRVLSPNWSTKNQSM